MNNNKRKDNEMENFQFVNCTPHEINLNDGRSFAPSGHVARVSMMFSKFDSTGVCEQVPGEVEGLPVLTGHYCGNCETFCEAESNGNCVNFWDCVENVIFIVSAMVLDANKRSKNPFTNLVAPATGHPETVRNEKGHIVSVPGFVK